MRKNWFVLIFAVALLAAVACLAAGCESTADEAEYVEKELLYSVAHSIDDVMEGGPAFICREPAKKCDAHYRGVGIYQADGTPVSIELTYYYKNIRTNEEYVYKFDDDGRLIWESVTGDTVYNEFTVHTYDSRGRCISTERTDKDGRVRSRRENEYDRKGRLILTSLSIYGGENEINLTYTNAYEYDRHGNIIVDTFTTESIYGDPRVKVTEYEYAKGNRLVKQTTYKDGCVDNVASYEYDAAGRLIGAYDAEPGIDAIEYQYNDDGVLVRKFEFKDSLTSKVVYEYQEDGEKLEKQTVYYDSGNLRSVIDYDENGYQRTSLSYHRDDGRPRSWYEYDYDAVGNLRSESFISREGFEYHYEYDYDYQGNRTSMTTYDEQGKIVDVQRFDIYGRVVRMDKYQGYAISECEKYVYSEPKYTGGFGSMESTLLRTEYCNGAGVVQKYIEHDGRVNRTYNSGGVLILLEEQGEYEFIDGEAVRYDTLTEYRPNGTVASVTVVDKDGEIVSQVKYDAAGNKIE